MTDHTPQRRKAVFDDADGFVADTFPGAMKGFGTEGWDDPAIDIYDDLDPRSRL